MMEKQWKSTWVGASWAMLAQNDTFLKPCWRKMTERIDFSLIFTTILGYQNHTKIDKKMKWFSDALKNDVFCARRSQGCKMEVQKTSKIKLALESTKTRESCSRLHAELVFKVWRAPKPHFLREPFSWALFMLHWSPCFSDFCWKSCPRECLSLIHIWRCRRRG